MSRREDGFTAHVEGEPETGLICACALTKASGATVGIALLTDDPTIAGPIEALGDSAYGTGEALAAAGHTAVIKPGPLRPAVPGGFTAGTCRPCPVRDRCTRSTSPRHGRQLTVRPREVHQAQTAANRAGPLRHPGRRRGHHRPGHYGDRSAPRSRST